jgi:Na+-transporting methylmalonyl-CoA/oxaloacetate decarboxylase gamma subunit
MNSVPIILFLLVCIVFAVGAFLGGFDAKPPTPKSKARRPPRDNESND